MFRDLFLMPTSQLQNIQRLDLFDAQCPDSHAQADTPDHVISAYSSPCMLPLSSLTMLEELVIHGIDSCPSLSSLSKLNRLVLVSHLLPTGSGHPGPPVYQASADLYMSQTLKVCLASSILLPPTSAFALSDCVSYAASIFLTYELWSCAGPPLNL